MPDPEVISPETVEGSVSVTSAAFVMLGEVPNVIEPDAQNRPEEMPHAPRREAPVPVTMFDGVGVQLEPPLSHAYQAEVVSRLPRLVAPTPTYR